MKRILLVMLLSISFTVYCQPKGTEVTMLEKLFSKGLDIVGKITQEKDGSRRELVPYKNKKQESIKKYLLTEYDNKEIVTASAYIVSKNDIQKDYPLFDIKLGNKHIINIDKLNQTEDNKLQGKLTVKINDDYINVTESVAKLPINTEAPGEICVDHWWVSWVVETGEIIEIVNMGSDCYTFGEPSTEGGGGGNDNSSSCDPSAVYPEEEEFNNHIQMRIVAASQESRTTSGENDDPISGSFTWTVAEGVVIGWKVEAVTSYSYLHDKYYNINIGGFEHIYNILSYQTSTPYYVGTNTFITSTYTNTATNDNILKNNTSAAQGKTEVYGRIQHVSKIEVRPPFCGPLNLDVVEEVRNTLNFLPK